MKGPAIILGIVVAIIGLFSSTFVVNEWEQAIKIELGKPAGTVTKPGLHFKKPFIQSVVTFDKRLLEYDASPREMITMNKQVVVVDNYSRWRIVDPLRFYTSVRTEAGAQSRLDDIIYSSLREQVGRFSLKDLVAGERAELMTAAQKEAAVKAKEFGIEIVDVRIKRADLPEKNQQNVFQRMRTERQRIAKKFRAEGEEEARKIRSTAEKEARIIEADAKKQSEIIKGEGDAKATRIYANAYNRDPDFYRFVRNLDSYKKTLKKNTTFVLSPQNEFLETFQSGR